MTVAVIGGGASGLMAALVASCGHTVTLFERQQRLGRKLSVTGNGRCNLTNARLTPERYHGEQPEFALAALKRFPPEETLRFFRTLGLLTVTEPDGRVYPFSDQAGSVVDVLRLEAAERNVEIRTSCEVTSVQRVREGFLVRDSSGGEERFQRVIVAAGGLAGTRTGSTDAGYKLLRALGHTVTPLLPSLVQLKTENSWTRPLKGVRADAKVTVTSPKGLVAETAGEVQFTEYGVSGPAVFEISREAVRAETPCVLHLDLLRGVEAQELRELLRLRLGTDRLVENLLTGTLHNKLGRTVLQRCGLSLSTPATSLTDGELEKIVRCVKDYALPVTGHLGMEGAQVTSGGVRVSEFVPETLESRIVPGLFACGEVLDVDGDCGGFNLQWAWSSGHAAGLLGEVTP